MRSSWELLLHRKRWGSKPLIESNMFGLVSVQRCWGQQGADREQAHTFHRKHTGSVVCQDASLLHSSVFYPCHCGGSNKGGFLARIKGPWSWSYVREDNVGKNTELFFGICLSTLILAVVMETVRPCSCVPRRVTSSQWWLWLTSTTNSPPISVILTQSVLAHRRSVTAWHAKLQCVNVTSWNQAHAWIRPRCCCCCCCCSLSLITSGLHRDLCVLQNYFFHIALRFMYNVFICITVYFGIFLYNILYIIHAEILDHRYYDIPG